MALWCSAGRSDVAIRKTQKSLPWGMGGISHWVGRSLGMMCKRKVGLSIISNAHRQIEA